jgi:hypothetical protein
LRVYSKGKLTSIPFDIWDISRLDLLQTHLESRLLGQLRVFR